MTRPELEITPARLALLRAVDDGAVSCDFSGRHWFVDAIAAGGVWPGRSGHRWIRVTARVRELEIAGLARTMTGTDWTGDVSLTPVSLTPAGKAVLDAHQ